MARFHDRRFRLARVWSNDQIALISPQFHGDMVNVSGWDDRDKEGGRYRQYFENVSTYRITNYGGDHGEGAEDEIRVDLESTLPDDLRRRFDVAFNHTTFEHVFNVFDAFHNFCEITKDAAIVVVPFAQIEHYEDSFGDYWRFTPQAIKKLFEKEGMSVVYCAVNNDDNAATYVLAVAVRDPAKWIGKFPPTQLPRNAASWLGRPRGVHRIVNGLRNAALRLAGKSPKTETNFG